MLTSSQRQFILQTLRDHVRQQESDAFVPYSKIQADTEVRMNREGRDLYRDAALAEGRPCKALYDTGYLLDGPENARMISEDRDRRMANAISKAKRDMSILQERHRSKMEPEVRRLVDDIDSDITRIANLFTLDNAMRPLVRARKYSNN